MGMKLTASQKREITAIKHAPRPGCAVGFLSLNPPTCTHQHKDLVMRGGRPRLVDARELVDAVEAYMIVVNQAPHAVCGPVGLWLTFRWNRLDARYRNRRKLRDWAQTCAAPSWSEQKPDWDNAAKTLQDVIAERGWIARDEGVSFGCISKIEIPPNDPLGAGVAVCIATLPKFNPFEFPQMPAVDAMPRILRFYPNTGESHAT